MERPTAVAATTRGGVGWFAWASFDSLHFGLAMAKWCGASAEPGWEAAVAQAVVRESLARGMPHLSARIPAELAGWIQAAESVDFRFVDTHVVLRFKGNKAPHVDAGPTIREASEADIAALLSLAKDLAALGRYANDPCLDPTKARRLYEAWITNNVLWRADRAWVAESEGRVVGLLTCLFDGRSASIDLVAVDRQVRGLGVGRALMVAAIRHYLTRAEEITVETQGSNYAALGLYTGLGMRPVRVEVTLHRYEGNQTRPEAETEA
jgi:ribosomal protein S18 acetylase RimI-like enzyme